MKRIGAVLIVPHEELSRGAYALAVAAAFVLAIAGGLIYLVKENDGSWWLGMLLVVPLLWLAFTRLPPSDGSTAGDPGPIAPP